jgi:hypothetical protein
MILCEQTSAAYLATCSIKLSTLLYAPLIKRLHGMLESEFGTIPPIERKK